MLYPFHRIPQHDPGSPLFEFGNVAAAVDIAVATCVLAADFPIERSTVLLHVFGGHCT